jgi:hypothetical protein
VSSIRPLGNAIPADRLQATNIVIPRDANALCERVMEAYPGEVIAYHRGELARDRDRLVTDLLEHERRDLDCLADYAWRLAHAGWGRLLQLREAPNCFLYLLVIRPRPHQRHASFPKPPSARRLAAFMPALREAA